VSVIDHHDAIVTGLPKNAFTVFDDKALQTIVSFQTEDGPCSAGIILDVSGRMGISLATAKEVVRVFLNTANPDDDFFLLTVSSNPQVQTDLTDDVQTIERNMQSVKVGGGALIDTIYLGLSKIRARHNPRRALRIVSDGIDNHSRYHKAELMRVATEADVQIYSISLAAPQTKQEGYRAGRGASRSAPDG
jgi:VWFA-related protein